MERFARLVLFGSASVVLVAGLGCAGRGGAPESKSVGPGSVPQPRGAADLDRSEPTAPSEGSDRGLQPERMLPTRALALSIGTFVIARDQADRIGAESSDRSVEALRRELPVSRPIAPLADDAAKFLASAAEALARNDAPAAIVQAEEAARIAPDRPEPVEVLLLAALGRGSGADVRAAIRRLSDLDPRNAIPLAFSGLEAIQRGADDEAVSALSWFIGKDALPRRGAAIPVPAAPGEIDEQCALAALRLGHAKAALQALESTTLARAAEPEVALRVAIARADALRALRQDEQAADRLSEALRSMQGAEGPGVGATTDSARALGALATLRLDALRIARGGASDVLLEAIDAALTDPLDAIALLRAEIAARHAAESARRTAERRIVSGAASGASASLRTLVLRSFVAAGGERDALARAVVRDARDRSALYAALRILAAQEPRLAVRTVCDAVGAQPNELDVLVTALLGSGCEVDALLSAVEREGLGASGDAVRSRILGLFGFHEESFAIADAARTRDRASACALAACALAAAELDDETLLAEVDDDAVGSGDAIARTLAACALRVGDLAKARDRAARARAFDSSDAWAEVIGAAALAADESTREEGLRILGAIARGTGLAADEAAARMGEIERGRSTSEAAPSPGSGSEGEGEGEGERRYPSDRRSSVRMLVAASADLARLRHPLALECLALAEEVDPSADDAREIVARASRPDAPSSLADWAHALAARAPALPSRRRILAGMHEPRTSNASARGSLASRFDALELSSQQQQARERVALAALRPRTPSAMASLAQSLLAAGDAEEAARVIEMAAGSTSRPLSARAASRLLDAASAVAAIDPAKAHAMRSAGMRILAGVSTFRPEDMASAMRLLIETQAVESEIDLAAAILARGCQRAIPDAPRRFSRVFESLFGRESDPFAVGRLADALAREGRLDPDVRGFLGNVAVALHAAAGAPAERSIELIRLLASEGVAAFVRPDDPTTTLAESLLRASSFYSLVGDAGGSDVLLEAAVEADPRLPTALNNLAFSRMESGRLDAEVVAHAELAARLSPDDPSVLDTLGVLRYHQGRFRDDAAGPGAITLFRQALRLKPNDPSLGTLEHLGDAMWRDGDQSGAIRVWRQVGEVAKLRYPPDVIARNLAAFQRREIGIELVSPAEVIRREYGRIVERAEQKLQEVARGQAPSVAPCLGAP